MIEQFYFILQNCICHSSGREDTNGGVNRTQTDFNDNQAGTQSLNHDELGRTKHMEVPLFQNDMNGSV